MVKTLSQAMEEDIAYIGEPLRLNIYDLTCMNGYMYWVGLGAYHSAIEAYGKEYAYGAHEYPSSGIFEVQPRHCPGYKFRKSLVVGTLWMGPDKFRDFIEEIACEYTGNSYNLLFKNCNHFCQDVCMRLVSLPLPNWVNRLAKIGSLCSCFIPKVLQGEAVNVLSYDVSDDSDSDDSDDKGSQRSFRQLAGNLAMVVPKRRHVITSIFFRPSLRDTIFNQDCKNGNLHRNESSERLTDL